MIICLFRVDSYLGPKEDNEQPWNWQIVVLTAKGSDKLEGKTLPNHCLREILLLIKLISLASSEIFRLS